jgi:hypothetical protein
MYTSGVLPFLPIKTSPLENSLGAVEEKIIHLSNKLESLENDSRKNAESVDRHFLMVFLIGLVIVGAIATLAR